MPDEASSDLAVAAGLAGQIYNSSVVAADSKKGRQFAKEQMEQQRAWALEDWNKQNEYNSASSQMARFKAAGLNPHLIYGQSQTAAPVRPTEPARGEFKHAPIDMNAVLGPLMQLYNLEQTRTQTDNLKAQKDLIIANTYLRDSQAHGVDWRNQLNDDTTAWQMDAFRLKNNILFKTALKQDEDIMFTHDQNARAALMSSANLAQAAEKLIGQKLENEKTSIGKNYLQQLIKNLKSDNQLKQYEIKLNQDGITKNAPYYIQMLHEIIDRNRPK